MRRVPVIGDGAHPEVLRVQEELRERGFECYPWEPTTPPLPPAIIAFLTSAEPPLYFWSAFAHRSMRILPAQFSGGTLPAIMADIASANFGRDWQRALDALVRALEQHFPA
ncbi:hypothetical protein HYV74_00800 [Candidatus Uhrbacteria bacterium]|nr:hypothetical protein [Candidatus Uhrbacteria bacterium]